jgi:ParB-like chromosome segregation protein Spo0J
MGCTPTVRGPAGDTACDPAGEGEVVPLDKYIIHPVADLFPLIDGQAFDELVADIKANGLIEPITVMGDQILDGRNRLRACAAAGIEPRFREVSPTDPAAYIVSLNIHRRHLTTIQRKAIAAELATLANGTNQFQQKVGGSNDPPTDDAMSNAQAASFMNVSAASVKRQKAIMRDHPDLHDAMKRGDKAAVREIKAEIKQSMDRQIAEGITELARINADGNAQRIQNEQLDRDSPEWRVRAFGLSLISSIQDINRRIEQHRLSGDPPINFRQAEAIGAELLLLTQFIEEAKNERFNQTDGRAAHPPDSTRTH